MGIFGNQTRRFRRARKQAYGVLQQGEDAQRKHYADVLPVAMGEQAATLDAINQGYDKAQGFAKKAFAGAREQVHRSAEQALGDMLTGLDRRGLGGIAGLRTGMRRSLRSDTELSLMNISDMLQRTQGGLAVGRGQDQANVYGQMLQTNLMNQRHSGLNRVRNQRLAFLSGLMSGGPPSPGAEMLQFGLDAAGTAFKGYSAVTGGGGGEGEGD